MALAVTHSTAADGTFSASGVTAWDAAHSLAGVASAAQGGTGIAYFTAAGPSVARTYTFPDADATILYSGGALGTPSSGTLTNATGLPYSGLAAGTAGNLITWDAAGAAAVVATGTATHVLTSNGAGAAPTFQAPAAGGSTLDGITAATADQAGILNADWNVVWKWAKVTNSEVAFTLTESAAATGGTSTSGIPNQVLLKLSTLAASTMSPLSVFVRGSHAFSISPTTGALLAIGNSSPDYSFASATTTGLGMRTAGRLTMYVSGTQRFEIDDASSHVRIAANMAANSANGVTDFTYDNASFGWPASGQFAIHVGQINSIWESGALTTFKASADAVGYALGFKKSRGTWASPTVITTADVLSAIGSYAYLGATNTYRETARIEVTSKGTISDATTGVGSIVTIYGKTQGTDATVQPTLVITDGSTATVKFPTYTAATFVAGDKYLVIDATGNIHVSAVGPAS